MSGLRFLYTSRHNIREVIADMKKNSKALAKCIATFVMTASMVLGTIPFSSAAAEPEGYQGPVISSKDQQKINTSLAAFGEEMKQQHGLYNLPMGGRYVNGVRLPE